jgi:hypothetical protein
MVVVTVVALIWVLVGKKAVSVVVFQEASAILVMVAMVRILNFLVLTP